MVYLNFEHITILPVIRHKKQLQGGSILMMNYIEAVNYIEEVPKFTKKNKPENTLELIRRLGHPERSMKVIHVAGTNG